MSDNYIDVAHQSTLEEVNVNVNVNKETLSTVKTNVNSVKSSVGSTKDTGGSISAGSIFGKLNKIISDIATHMNSWSSTRAGYIDNIRSNTEGLHSKVDTLNTVMSNTYSKVDTEVADIQSKVTDVKTDLNTVKIYSNTVNEALKQSNTENATGTIHQKLTAIWNLVSDRIGTTDATGGTTTAGTIMAKLNAIISKVNTGVVANKWYASYGSSNVVKSTNVATTITAMSSSNGSGLKNSTTIFTFYAPADGVYTLNLVVHFTAKYEGVVGALARFFISDYSKMVLGYSEGDYYHADTPFFSTIDVNKEGEIAFGDSFSAVNTSVGVYLEGGRRYKLSGKHITSYSDEVVIKLASASITYDRIVYEK